MNQNIHWTFYTIIELFSIFDGFDGPSTDEVWWRTDNGYAPVTMFVNCNDVFAWGCSDCQIVRPEDIDALKQAKEDLRVANDGNMAEAGILWIARKRKQRPQVACYEYYSDAEKKLFDECGPESTQYGRGRK